MMEVDFRCPQVAQPGLFTRTKRLSRERSVLLSASRPSLLPSSRRKAPGEVREPLRRRPLAKLSRLSGEGQADVGRNLIQQALRLILGLLPFAGMVAGAAPEVVAVIFGRPFLPASPLLSWLIFASFGFMLISMSTATLTAAGRPGLTLALTGPLVLLAPLAHGVLIPRFGPLGAAAATTVLAWLGGGATLLAVYRTYQVLPPAATLGRSVLIGGLAYALAVLWPAPGFGLLLKIPVICFVVGVAFGLLGEFSAGEKSQIRSFLRRASGRKWKRGEA